MQKYPLNIEFVKIPLLKNHTLEIISLFKKEVFNYDAYFFEYSKIYNQLIELNKNSLIITEKKFLITHEKLIEFEHVSTLLDKDIIVLTNVFLD